MHISYISSFVPRKCGLATYTRDLSLEIANQQSDISVFAMENITIPVSYSAPVVQKILQNEIRDYKQTAHVLNNSSADIVHLQHEFGLFGGDDGGYIVCLAKELTKPLIVTFHTVLLTPTEHQKYIIQELTRLSRKVIVMEEVAKHRLEHVYGLNSKDVAIILHGAPEITMKQDIAKKNIDLSKYFILLANNLLSRNKGIEYAIEAVEKSVSRIPNLLFLVVGETHPLVKNEEGESYREELIELVKKLHMEEHVKFINKYIPLEELKVFLAAADIYITPYLDPQQITSGTLSYAIGANKACIATKYVYAMEMLSKNKGILVPFRDSDAISSALVDLYKHPIKRHKMEKKANNLKKDMSWPRVAEKHKKLYQNVLNDKNRTSENVKNFLRLPVDISYLSHLTNTIGIMQHAYHTIPDRRFGYSTDDNARALIVVSQLEKIQKNKKVHDLTKIYINFLQYAQELNGGFHTFLDFHNNWLDKANITDAYGKTMWALGHYLYTNKYSALNQPVHTLFITSLEHARNVFDLRNASYTILGLYYYILAYNNKTDSSILAEKYLIKLADLMITSFEKTNNTEWIWFENDITYDNFRLPQALFAAYMVTHEKKYKETAIKTLQFITDCNFDKKKGYYDFIGQNGWYKKGGKKANYDQQPLEAAGAVEANVFAAKVLKKKSYKDDAYLAFKWFLGWNRNHRYLYDKHTKGVHDGLNLRGTNQNEGAESVICFLMASLSLRYSRKD